MKFAARFLLILLLLVFLAPSGIILAQINFMDGWVITTENDTLNGYIKDCGNMRASRICLFRESTGSKTVKYGPRDIRAYQIRGGRYFRSIDHFPREDSAPSFSLVLIEGDLDLYHNRKNRRMAYIIQKQGSEPLVLIKKEVLVYRESDILFYGNSSTNSFMVPVYRDSLRSFFGDSENIRSQVENVDYNQKSLINITKAYLQETCEDDNCISYEKDISLNRTRLGFYTGVYYSQIRSIDDTWKSVAQSTIPIGALYNIPLSLINDRLSFQIEIVYRRLKYDEALSTEGTVLEKDIALNLIGLPLSLNYEFSKKRFSPTIAMGNEAGIYIIRDSDLTTGATRAYLARGGLWFANVGMDYDLDPDLSLFMNLRLSGYPFAFNESKVYIVANKTNFRSSSIALHLGVRF